jgi:hypothetical protein
VPYSTKKIQTLCRTQLVGTIPAISILKLTVAIVEPLHRRPRRQFLRLRDAFAAYEPRATLAGAFHLRSHSFNILVRCRMVSRSGADA